jgi:hypothetical protein
VFLWLLIESSKETKITTRNKAKNDSAINMVCDIGIMGVISSIELNKRLLKL